MIKKVLDKVLELLYPKTCCFCGKVSEKVVCDICAKKILYISEPRCKRCGKPVRYEEQEYCYDCTHGKYFFEQGRSVWLHKEPVNYSIYQFKYHNKRIYAKFYASELFRLYGGMISKWGIDLIIPVPLHWKRRRGRGYNQAEIIAKYLGEYTGIPVESHVLIRKYYTNPQKKLGNKERRENLRGAFALKRKWEKPKKILLVDDIYTTGSTINEISRVLCENCGNKVWFLTISIGQDF